MTYRPQSTHSTGKKTLSRFFLRLALFVVLVVCAVFITRQTGQLESTDRHVTDDTGLTSLARLAEAYENHLGNIQVKQSGRIIKLLPDDTQYPRHQRFIIQLSSQQQLLVSHNIELAPRVDNLKAGERILFFGEYAWNNKGGVIHWTHRDPKHRHPNGWLNYNNRQYD